MRTYQTPARTRKTAEVTLEDGRVLKWKKPKAAKGLLRLRDMLSEGDDNAAVLVKSSMAILDQLEAGLSEEDAEYLANRLRDDEDDFDMSDIRAILDGFIEDTADVPPTSGGDSGEQ
jgi:hypothetical protein